MSEVPEPSTGGAQTPDLPGSPALLDSNSDNPTRWEKGLSRSDEEDDETGEEEEWETDWNRQQKRSFHRVNTLLHYWESRDYEIVWVTLTSSPDSDDADCLAYNLQRLRQTIERARAAVDADGKTHSLTHIDRLEQLCIRTSEGPEDKGVLHLFWAWKPPNGAHSRRLFIPQRWLSEQWGRIHGPHDEHDPEPVQPLYVWIEKYGGVGYHDRRHIARYCVTQYLGDHAEALEHVSWSHGRSLGGSLLEAWTAVRKHSHDLDQAVDRWERVIAGESITVGPTSEYINYGLCVRPPPNLGVEETLAPEVHPPEDWQPHGPGATSYRTMTPSIPEVDIEAHGRECPDCGSLKGLHQLPEGHPSRADDDRVSALCVSCKSRFASPGEGGRIVVVGEWEDAPDLSAAHTVATRTRQSKLDEFEGIELPPLPDDRDDHDLEPREKTGVGSLTEVTRAKSHDPLRHDNPERTLRTFVKNHPDTTAIQALARSGVPVRFRSLAESLTSESR